MKKKKLNLKLIGIVVAIVIIAVIIYRKNQKTAEEIARAGSSSGSSSGSSTSTSTTSTGKVTDTLGNDASLKMGTKGREVRWVQYYYNHMIATPQKKTKLAEDGIFGTKTQTAVKSVLGKTTTSWTEWKRFLDANYSTASTATSSTKTDVSSYDVAPAESTAVNNLYAFNF